MRTLLVILTLSVMLAHGAAAADGVYQKTRDGRTNVWNSEPKPGDEATWSGDRDADGYAKGFGTLTWYSVAESSSSGADKKAVLFARYFGRMDHGKLSGPVNVHVKGKTRYAIFVDGERATRWTAGTAPYRAGADAAALIAKKTKRESREPEAPAEGPTKVKETPPTETRSTIAVEKPKREPAEPEAPAEGPTKVKENPPAETRSTTAVEKPKREVAVTKAKPSLPNEKSTPKEADSSLQILAGPPSALRHDLPPAPEPVGELPHLTSDEVVEVGDAAVRTHGYDPATFTRSDAHFDAQSATWSVSYATNNNPDPDAKGFTVTIDDATKGTVFVPAK